MFNINCYFTDYGPRRGDLCKSNLLLNQYLVQCFWLIVVKPLDKRKNSRKELTDSHFI